MTQPWKFFCIEVTYRIPVEELGERVALHRAYLQIGYDQGWLLMSGPQNPKTGGMIIARAPSREAIVDFFSRDPYQVNGLADYRFVEFEPVKHQDLLKDWISQAA
jgi:uncharacterized protein YciI